MSGCWILKTEPSTYGYDDLARERTAVWDGVKNPVAIRNLRAMKAGDDVLIYHTGDEKAVVGKAEVVKGGVDAPQIRATGRLTQPVTLAEIRQDQLFADSPLVKQPRLSVIPLTEAQYRRLAG